MLYINKEASVRASLGATFDALLEQMGPHNETPEGKPLPMKIEAWPGGRWYRWFRTCNIASANPTAKR
jgi:hypothetical protein